MDHDSRFILVEIVWIVYLVVSTNTTQILFTYNCSRANFGYIYGLLFIANGP